MHVMKIEDLKERISAANLAYRAGTPIMSDQEFDDLLEKFQNLVSEAEYNKFRDTLHEVKGKVKHPYILGSLDKLKSTEPEALGKFLLKNVKTKLNVSAKVDGISCRCHYENGKLKNASTRGNGTFGEDLTDKISLVKGVVQNISRKETLDVRGELVILKSDFADFVGEFANPRNATAGLMNRKDYDIETIKRVSFIPYTILGDKFTKAEQLKILADEGFNVAWNIEIDPPNEADEKLISQLVEWASEDRDYETDGLVISDSTYKNEEQYRPKAQVAFKINQLIAETTILDVAFDGPSKDGTHCPVAILEPVELGGAMISRASLHNLDIIESLGVRYGSKVKLLRSGDVIPKIIEVISSPKGAKKIKLPDECNCCHSKLVRDSVNLRCVNPECKDQIVQQIYKFFCKLGVKSAAAKTLDNLKIYSYDDLLTFVPDSKSKTQKKLAEELKSKVFTRSKKDLLSALNFRGLSETLISRIVDFYGWDAIEDQKFVGFPDGVGDVLLDKFKDCLLENLKVVNKLISDVRYSYSGSDLVASSSKSAAKNGMSVCFTGKLNTMTRGEAEEKAQKAGFEIKSVNKKLTYLVTNDTDSGSSKNKKAKELGIKVISEAEFLKMLSAETVESDIGEL